MYGGDRARKKNLVEFGFRLPAAFDNRPLRFEEFHSLIKQIIYVSATPANFELEEAEGVVVEQLIRPTGLLDPEIEVRPSENQIDNLMEEILVRAEKRNVSCYDTHETNGRRTNRISFKPRSAGCLYTQQCCKLR